MGYNELGFIQASLVDLREHTIVEKRYIIFEQFTLENFFLEEVMRYLK